MEIIDSPFKSSHLEGSKIAYNSKTQVLQPKLKHILRVVEHLRVNLIQHYNYELFWDELSFICHAGADVLYVDYLHTNLIYSNGLFGNFEVFC